MKSSYVNKPVPFKCQSLPQYNWAINFKLEGCARNRKLTKTREEARKEYKKLMDRMNVSKVDCGIADDLTIKSMDKIIALSKKVDMMPSTLLEEYLSIKNNLGVDDLAGFLKRYLQHASRVNHELTLKDASEIFIESIQDRSRRYINCTRQCTMSTSCRTPICRRRVYWRQACQNGRHTAVLSPQSPRCGPPFRGAAP